MMLSPLRVFFLSTGNAVRSILAEALLNSKGSDRFTARSAGCCPLPSVHPETLELLRASGIATDGLHTKGWTEFMSTAHSLRPDVVVTLSEEARLNNPSWSGNPIVVHWAVDDPLGAERADIREWKFRKCFATLDARIAALVRSRIPTTPGGLFMQLKDIGMVV